MRCWGYEECLVPLPVDHDYCYDEDDVDFPVQAIVIVMNYYQQQQDETIEMNLVRVLRRTNRHDHRVQILVIASIVHFLLNLEFDHYRPHSVERQVLDVIHQ